MKDRFPSRSLVWGAVVLALVPGFGLGGLLFAAPALGLPIDAWWSAAAQAHGHAQLFGFGGLMVFGVGMHFLPRLRGRPLVRPDLISWVLALLGGGVALRALAQPLVALSHTTPLGFAAALGLGLSGLLELGGAMLGIGLLVATGRGEPPLRERAGVLAVLPMVATAFVGLVLALLINLAGVLAAALNGSPLVAPPVAAASILLGFLGFVVPISAGMSARTFPLYLATPVVPTGRLVQALTVLTAGLLLRLIGLATESRVLEASGEILVGLALLGLILTLGVLGPRQARLGTIQFHAASLRASNSLILSAYIWLAIAALLALWAALAVSGWIPAPSPDAERHALGAGFMTLLIFGMGSRLLPGFGRQQPPTAPLIWAIVALGNTAALLRVGPPLAAWLRGVPIGPVGTFLMAAAGPIALAATVCFIVAVAPALRRPKPVFDSR